MTTEFENLLSYPRYPDRMPNHSRLLVRITENLTSMASAYEYVGYFDRLKHLLVVLSHETKSTVKKHCVELEVCILGQIGYLEQNFPLSPYWDEQTVRYVRESVKVHLNELRFALGLTS